jgi:parallel beta-helix repeat protein
VTKEGKAKGELIMNKKHFYAAVILLLFLAIGIQPALAIDIPNDDENIGTWNDDGTIYTLAKYFSEGLVIVQSDFTLDGAGHTVTGTGTDTGIFVNGKTGVTVKNVTVSGFEIGIRLSDSDWNTLMYTTTVNNFHGIWLDSSDNNTLSNNTVSYHIGNGAEGIGIHGSESNSINGNTIQNNHNGIVLMGQTYNNEVYNNDFIDNTKRQACLWESTGSNNKIYNNNFKDVDDNGSVTLWQVHVAGGTYNEIYNNNFISGPDTEYQAYVTGGNYNVFNLELPIGGNYWSNWTTPDVDGNGIVDLPYVFTGGQDNYPWVMPDGWLTPPTPQALIVQLIDTVEDMNLQQGIDNSLDAKLDAAFNALDDVNDNNNVAAINSLNAFKNAVEAQRDNKLNGAQADELIAQADSIIDMLIE